MTPETGIPIKSLHNPKVQFIRSLLKEKSARTEHDSFIVEGIRLAEEALEAGIYPRLILYSSQLSARGKQLLEEFQSRGCETLEVYTDILDRLSDTETSQGMLLVMPLESIPLPGSTDLVLIIDQVRDPGNLGTILRSATAVGVKLVFLTPGSVDPYMPKVVRAGMGAHFQLCLRQASWPDIKRYCVENQSTPLKIFLADASGGRNMWQTDLSAPLALVVGGEAEGASQSAHEFIDELIHIPMPGKFESLNAGVAASILLYEILRQRNP